MDSGERGMNLDVTIIIGPRKEYSPNRDRTSDLLFSGPVCYRLSHGVRSYNQLTAAVPYSNVVYSNYHWKLQQKLFFYYYLDYLMTFLGVSFLSIAYSIPDSKLQEL